MTTVFILTVQYYLIFINELLNTNIVLKLEVFSNESVFVGKIKVVEYFLDK